MNTESVNNIETQGNQETPGNQEKNNTDTNFSGELEKYKQFGIDTIAKVKTLYEDLYQNFNEQDKKNITESNNLKKSANQEIQEYENNSYAILINKLKDNPKITKLIESYKEYRNNLTEDDLLPEEDKIQESSEN